jgi:long-chain acyl-CoA synthetase
VRCEVLTAPWDGLTAEKKPTRPGSENIDQDLACLIYTSGSTGAPKGVMHTHQSLVSVTRSIVSYLGLRAEDVVLSVLPLSFGYGLTQLLTTFYVGATLVLERSFAFPQMTLQKMQNERVTTFAMVPTIATILLNNDLARFDLSSLRRMTNAGAGIAPDLLRRLREQFSGVRIFPMYGQTECIRASYLAPELIDEKPLSVGKAIPNTELWIVDDDGRKLPNGHTGELVVRGANVMRGYWERPEATAQKLRPGRVAGESVLFTGDLFRVDDDGFFYFVARKDDIIKTRGEKVSPREVENVLHAHEAVLEAAVIGIPDAILGEVVKAYVVPRDRNVIDEKTVLRHCAAHLEDFAVPKRVEFLDALPTTPNEKIDKLALRAREQAT